MKIFDGFYKALKALGLLALDFLRSGKFALLSLSALISTIAAVLSAVYWVAVKGERSGLAYQFLSWCLASTNGSFEWSYLLMYLFGPLVVSVLLLLLWKEEILFLLKKKAFLSFSLILSGVLIVASLIYNLKISAKRDSKILASFGENFLEAQKISVPFKEFALIDQRGKPFNTKDLDGKVLVVTFFYSRCNGICPLILADIKRFIGLLQGRVRDEVRVAAITIDPDYDTEKVLQEVAKRYKFSTPPVYLLSGKPDKVREVINSFDFTRIKGEKGEIIHQGVFILVNREKK
ncbi:MAG: SCO family protein, partial [Candidatus Dadabacteria bacterium]